MKDFSLAIEEGEFLVLLGPSGCGKTTTLRMIAGFVDADRRAASRSAARDVTDLPPDRRNTGMVFQSYALFPHMTVARERRLRPGDAQASPKAEIAARVARRCALVRLDELADR